MGKPRQITRKKSSQSDSSYEPPESEVSEARLELDELNRTKNKKRADVTKALQYITSGTCPDSSKLFFSLGGSTTGNSFGTVQMHLDHCDMLKCTSLYAFVKALKEIDSTLLNMRIAGMDDRSLFTMLSMVKGIGAWSVHMFMIGFLELVERGDEVGQFVERVNGFLNDG